MAQWHRAAQVGLGLLTIGLGWATRPMAARADAPFGVRQVVSAAVVDPVRAIAVDLDRDGDLDLVSIGNGDLTIAWHERDALAPTGYLPRQPLFVMGTTMSALAAGDIDGDGWLDLLVALNPSNQFVWLRNAGGSPPVLQPPLLISSFADLPSAIDTADFDRDGDLDVVTASVADDRISWHENLGGNPPAWISHQITFDPDGPGGIFEGAANSPFDVKATDIDRDGRIDVIIASSQDDTIQWFRNEPGAPVAFSPQIKINLFVDQAIHLSMGDLDGDGDEDAVSTAFGGATVQWHENRNAFSVQLPSQRIAVLFGPMWTDAGDIDNDGDVDVISAASTSALVQWSENDGAAPPHFTNLVIDGMASGASYAALADLDGDGDLDATVITRGDQTIAWRENRLVHRAVALASQPSIATLGAGVVAAAAGDVDRDGDVDVMAASGADGVISLLPSMAAQRASGFAGATPVGTFPSVSAIRLADVDRDGDLDVLLVSESAGSAAWIKDNGGDPPSFGAAQALATFAGVSDIAAGDLDGDGAPDIVLGSVSASDLLALDSDGALPPVFTPRSLAATAGGSAVALADLDRDGDLDIATAGGPGGGVRWLRNSGGGAFTQIVIASAPAGARASLRVADFDRDGDPDIAVAFEGGSSVLLYRNDGGASPSFAETTIASALSGAFPIDAVDFDRDGDMDVVVGLSGGADWIENLGGSPPVFAAHPIPGAPASPRGLALGDFNRDGDMDALLGAPSSGDMTPVFDVGGQASIAAASVAPTALADGQTAALLRLDVVNEGRPGDAAARIAALRFRLLNDSGAPISQALAPFLFASFALHVDNGDGVFNAADDAQIASKPASMLGFVAGEFTLTTPSLTAETVVDAGTSRRVFLVATMAGAASAQGVAGVRAVHVAGGANEIEDAITFSPLLLTPAQDVATPVIALQSTAPCPGDVTGDRMVGPDDLLALLAAWANPFGPTDLLELLSNFGAVCP